MHLLRGSLVGFGLAGLLLAGIAACVGDASPSSSNGALDGPCYANGSCNPGLACTPTTGGSKCLVVTPDASADDGGTDAAVDAGPRVCPTTPTPFPCSGPPQGFACYGQAQDCSPTGCNTDVAWQCFSPNQCSKTPCCIASSIAALTPTPDCSLGALKILADDAGGAPPIASVCGSGAACPAGDIQLCQYNSQCPKGQVCSPVKVSGSGASANSVVISACMPE